MSLPHNTGAWMPRRSHYISLEFGCAFQLQMPIMIGGHMPPRAPHWHGATVGGLLSCTRYARSSAT